MSTPRQLAFAWGVAVEIAGAADGARKAQIANLRPGEPLIVASESVARSCQTVARSLGLRSMWRQVAPAVPLAPTGKRGRPRGAPEREFQILGPLP